MSTASASNLRFDLAASLALVMAVILVFGQAAGFDFLTWDDTLYVTENARVRAGLSADNLRWVWSATEACNWHPLTWLSHMLDAQLYGMAPAGHHLGNVGLHAANSVLLYAFFRKTTGAAWRSALVAMLFAIHPLHVESVAWVSERKDVLSTFFWLSAMLAYAGYARRPGIGRYLAVTLCIAAGLSAKPMVVTLPLVLLLVDVWPLMRFRGDDARPPSIRRRSRLVLEKLPWLGLSAISSALTVHAQTACGAVGKLSAVPLPDRLAHAALGYADYLFYTLFPWNLSYFHPLPEAWSAWRLIVALAVLAAVSLWAWRSRHRHPERGIGWLWYLGTLVPVIGLVQVGNQAIAHRYTYVPLIGIFVMLAWAAPRAGKARQPAARAAGMAIAALLAAYGALAFWQARFWQDPATLYRRAIEIEPNNHTAHASLADVLARRGLDAEASRQAELALRPGASRAAATSALVTLGVIAQRGGRPEEALRRYADALAIDPSLATAHYNRGRLLNSQQRHAEAATEFAAALRLAPEHARALNGLGFALLGMGRSEEAAARYRQAIAIEPDYAEAHFNLGVAMESLGRPEQAIASHREAVRLGPGNVIARLRLGRLLLLAGRKPEAIAQFEAVLGTDPQNGAARRLLEAADDARSAPPR